MTKTVGYRWHLRKLMSEHGMHHTTALVPLLADRGVVMTPTQVYRISTGEPERLNMQLLAALCDIFGCTPNDLIEPYVVATSSRRRKTAASGSRSGGGSGGGRGGAAGGPAKKASKNRPRRALVERRDPDHP